MELVLVCYLFDQSLALLGREALFDITLPLFFFSYSIQMKVNPAITAPFECDCPQHVNIHTFIIKLLSNRGRAIWSSPYIRPTTFLILPPFWAYFQLSIMFLTVLYSPCSIFLIITQCQLMAPPAPVQLHVKYCQPCLPISGLALTCAQNVSPYIYIYITKNLIHTEFFFKIESTIYINISKWKVGGRHIHNFLFLNSRNLTLII